MARRIGTGARTSANAPASLGGLPSRDAIIAFIEGADTPVGRREIARAFHVTGADRIALKALLKDMTDEGLVDLAPGRAFHRHGGVPRVTTLTVVAVEDGVVLAEPDRWEADGPRPRLRVIEDRGGRGPAGRGGGRRAAALTVGDRILARTEEEDDRWLARTMKRLQRGPEAVLGLLVTEPGLDGRDRLLVRPVDKRERYDWPLAEQPPAGVTPGDLVRVTLSGRGSTLRATVVERLGDALAPRSLSMIAIAKHGLPTAFDPATLAEADRAAKLPVSGDRREDLRHLPILAIDPVDARDHDDAIWAQADPDPDNPGGFRAIVAIADVSFYVRPGGALDRDARRRGNSVYFPDQVVPMLPERLSADVCSLKEGADRAAMVVHLVIGADGCVRDQRFARAIIRVAANIAYEDAQAAIDGIVSHPLTDAGLRPLWACWGALSKARADREPLELDLPERQVLLDAKGGIASIRVRERLDAHRVVEDFMIAANVAAARVLEVRKAPVMYRVHEEPSREKLVALKTYLASLGRNFALGQVVRPRTFNAIIAGKTEDLEKPLLTEAILRTQTQAYYAPRNAGHFGLALPSYAHFTSPIRRYADLLVHRALVDACELDDQSKGEVDLPARTGLGVADARSLSQIGEAISALERRAMEAERETVDRYVAAWLSGRVGTTLSCRITGVQSFGFFASPVELGGDGLVPVSTLGAERFIHDEASRTLTGNETGDRYAVGMVLDLRLVDANVATGSLRFALPEASDHGASSKVARPKVDRHGARPVTTARRGRPANIRHQGRRR